jgi:hypothetical protein
MTSDHAEPNVSYETSAPNAYQWTDKAYDLLQAGRLTASVHTKAGIQTATVEGDCPHCHHDVNYRQVFDAVAGEPLSTLGERTTGIDVGYVPLTVSCQCTEFHKGRPDKIDHGCGINFRIDVLPDA